MSKRPFHATAQGREKKRAKKERSQRFEGSHDEVLLEDVRQLLASAAILEGSRLDQEGQAQDAVAGRLPEKFSEIEVKVSELSSTGDGLGFSSSPNHVYVVPFALPGDVVQAKAVHTKDADQYTVTDFVKVLSPSLKRNNDLVRCPYFAKCSGCQFQMMKYEDQLAHKKTIVEKAYRNFSGLAPEAIPIVGDTFGSPLEYGYRTKLTPHFDGPPGAHRRKGKGLKLMFEEVPPIGFMQKGTRWTIDIEDCPIGTDAVRAGMKQERERVAGEIGNYQRGATLLLRESTNRTAEGDLESNLASDSITKPLKNGIAELKDDTQGKCVDTKVCVTDSNATSTEYVDSYVFTNPAGAFFQNNNSILPIFTQYIRDQITLSSSNTAQPPTHLIDAYCGSGLFTITLSTLFQSSMGIDISGASINSAKKNAELNNTKNTTFIAATASELFRSVDSPPDQTAVVIDPPRKGCDESFLEQLLAFGPRTIIYVSCNVHTQARDVGVLVNGLEKEEARYSIKSLRGFDFFPQTGHVEGVAMLERVTNTEKASL